MSTTYDTKKIRENLFKVLGFNRIEELKRIREKILGMAGDGPDSNAIFAMIISDLAKCDIEMVDYNVTLTLPMDGEEIMDSIDDIESGRTDYL
jgi:hypothetical protein